MSALAASNICVLKTVIYIEVLKFLFGSALRNIYLTVDLPIFWPTTKSLSKRSLPTTPDTILDASTALASSVTTMKWTGVPSDLDSIESSMWDSLRRVFKKYSNRRPDENRLFLGLTSAWKPFFRADVGVETGFHAGVSRNADWNTNL